MENDERIFKFEISETELKESINKQINDKVANYIKQNDVDSIMRDTITKIFDKPLSSQRASKIREEIEDILEQTIRHAIYESMDKSGLKETINEAVMKHMKNPDVIKKLIEKKLEQVVLK